MQDPVDGAPKKQNVTELRKVGTSFVNSIKAVSDGFDVEDMGAGMTLISAIKNAADDFKVDFETAAEEVVGQIMEDLAKLRREKKGIEAVT